MNANLDVRPSPIAGQWYPGDKNRLSLSVDQYIQAAKSSPSLRRMPGISIPARWLVTLSPHCAV
jgi:hypothetical protein